MQFYMFHVIQKFNVAFVSSFNCFLDFLDCTQIKPIGIIITSKVKLKSFTVDFILKVFKQVHFKV